MAMAYPNPQLIGYTQSTSHRVTVTTSTVLIPANPDRLYLEIANNSAQAIWVSKGVAASVGQGMRILPGGVRTFTNNELYLGQVTGIVASGSATIDVEEGT